MSNTDHCLIYNNIIANNIIPLYKIRWIIITWSITKRELESLDLSAFS